MKQQLSVWGLRSYFRFFVVNLWTSLPEPIRQLEWRSGKHQTITVELLFWNYHGPSRSTRNEMSNSLISHSLKNPRQWMVDGRPSLTWKLHQNTGLRMTRVHNICLVWYNDLVEVEGEDGFCVASVYRLRKSCDQYSSFSRSFSI